MQFASPLTWWLALVIAGAIAAIALLSYRRPPVPLSGVQRGVLQSLRALSMATVVLLICRPVLLLPPVASGDVVIPVLVDASRSMSVVDADGDQRMTRAVDLLRTQLLPALAARGSVELFRVSDAPSPASIDDLGGPVGLATDLQGAIASVRDRYRGRRVAGVVLLSDGGDTRPSSRAASPSPTPGPPVFAIGVGSPEGVADREVTGMIAGDPRIDLASVELQVSTTTRGFGTAPFQLRVLANGQLVESRTVAPVSDGLPIHETFTVAPDPLIATVYRAEVAAGPEEAILENNARSVLVNPAGRRRRVLLLSGAPGFDYSFLVRALSDDPGLEVDSIVRKGQNEGGDDTFLVQAGGGRAAALLLGFPASLESLFGYDALIIVNVEGDFFTRAQMEMTERFVSERGGGLLLLGGRSFERRGFSGTPLEQALPLELDDRRGVPAAAQVSEEDLGRRNAVTLTPQGETHPVMRLGRSLDDSRKRWAALPPLASTALLGGARPGASVLAVTSSASGTVLPVVAVQPYGRGRSMMFAGEAAWRWRMLLPSSDGSYDQFWRQAARWLSADSPDPVMLSVPDDAQPGENVSIDLDVRNLSFQPAPGAAVDVTLASPGEQPRALAVRPTTTGGRFVAAAAPEVPGLYRVRAEARIGGMSLGVAERWFQVGGSNREFADPRLNEGFLRRLARASGGQYVRAADAPQIVDRLQAGAPVDAEPVRRDLWHEPWAFAVVIGLLAGEWLLRRRWGLR